MSFDPNALLDQNRLYRLLTDLCDLIFECTYSCSNFDNLTLLLTLDSCTNGGLDGKTVAEDIFLVLVYEAVYDLFLCLFVTKCNCRTERNLCLGDLVVAKYNSVLEECFDLLNSLLVLSLSVLCVIVLGVLGKVTLCTCFCKSLCDLGSYSGLSVGKLVLKSLKAFRGLYILILFSHVVYHLSLLVCKYNPNILMLKT